jgi:hypothetical protein
MNFVASFQLGFRSSILPLTNGIAVVYVSVYPLPDFHSLALWLEADLMDLWLATTNMSVKCFCEVTMGGKITADILLMFAIEFMSKTSMLMN